jgi:hypothetical protein
MFEATNLVLNTRVSFLKHRIYPFPYAVITETLTV